MVRRIDAGTLPDLETLQRLGRARRFYRSLLRPSAESRSDFREGLLLSLPLPAIVPAGFNQTPHQYLIHRRIEKAKELLSEDDLRVTDVCFEVGFRVSVRSARSFIAASVTLPATYRERAQAKRQIPGCFLVMHKLESA
jgi:hypothetical protein